MFTAYLPLLKKRDFFLLWLGQIISQFGDRLTQMAIVGLVYQAQGVSSFTLAKMFSLSIIPVFLVSPVAGVYIDRWDKRKTMYTSDFLRAGFLCLIPIFYLQYKNLAPLYVLIFLSFCVGKMFVPAKMAMIPFLVRDKDLLKANSLISLTSMIAAVLGLGLGGVLVEKCGAPAALYINAATFLVSAMLVFFMGVKDATHHFKVKDLIEMSREAVLRVEQSVVFEAKQGIRFILKSPATRYAVAMKILLFAVLGSLYTIFIVFIQHTFNTVTKDLGWLAISAGAGLFAGTVLYGRWGHRFAVKPAFNISLLACGAWLTAMVMVLNVWPAKLFAVAACFLLGILCSPLEIGINTLIHQDSGSQNGFLGRVFSSLEVLLHLAFIIFMFAASCLAEKYSAFAVIVGVGLIVFSFAAVQLILGFSRKREEVLL